MRGSEAGHDRKYAPTSKAAAEPEEASRSLKQLLAEAEGRLLAALQQHVVEAVSSALVNAKPAAGGAAATAGAAAAQEQMLGIALRKAEAAERSVGSVRSELKALTGEVDEKLQSLGRLARKAEGELEIGDDVAGELLSWCRAHGRFKVCVACVDSVRALTPCCMSSVAATSTTHCFSPPQLPACHAKHPRHPTAAATLDKRVAAAEFAASDAHAAVQSAEEQLAQLGDLHGDLQRLGESLGALQGHMEVLDARQERLAQELGAAGELASDDAMALLARVAGSEERASRGMEELAARLQAMEEQQQQWQQEREQERQGKAAAGGAGGLGGGQQAPAAVAYPGSGEAAAAVFAALLTGDCGLECAVMAPSTLEEDGEYAPAPLLPASRGVRQVAGGDGETALTTVAAASVESLLQQLAARVDGLEREVRQQREAAPVDGLSAGALEARVCILEDDYLERQRKAYEEEEQQRQQQEQREQQQNEKAGSGQQLGSLLPADRLPESLRAVEALGDQLEALLERFSTSKAAMLTPDLRVPHTSAGRGSATDRSRAAIAAADAAAEAVAAGEEGAAAATGAVESEQMSKVEALAGRVAVLEAAMHEMERRTHPEEGDAAQRMGRVEADLSAALRAHEASVGAASEREMESRHELQQLRDRLGLLALEVAAEAEASRLHRESAAAAAGQAAAAAASHAAAAAVAQGAVPPVAGEAAEEGAGAKGSHDHLTNGLSEVLRRMEAIEEQVLHIGELEEEVSALVQAVAGATARAAEAAAAAEGRAPAAVETAAKAAAEAQDSALQAAAAAETAAAVGAKVADLQGVVDGLSDRLHELRVETQNSAEDCGKRLQSLETLRDDLEIWQAGQRAAAERAERAAAEALERAEELASAVGSRGTHVEAAAQAEALAAACSAADAAQASIAVLQEQLGQLVQRVDGLQAQQEQELQQQRELGSSSAQGAAAAAAALQQQLGQLVQRMDGLQAQQEQQPNEAASSSAHAAAAAAAELQEQLGQLVQRMDGLQVQQEQERQQRETASSSAQAAAAAAADLQEQLGQLMHRMTVLQAQQDQEKHQREAASSSAQAAAAAAAELQEQLGQLVLRMDALHAQQEQEQHETASDSAQAAASAAAAAELTLRMQASATEASERLEKMSGQVAAARAALEAESARISSIEAVAASSVAAATEAAQAAAKALTLAEQAQESGRDTAGVVAEALQRVDVLEEVLADDPGAAPAGASPAAAVGPLAAGAAAGAASTRPMGILDLEGGAAGGSGAGGLRSTFSPLHRGIPNWSRTGRASVDSLDSPSFSRRQGGTISYPLASSPGASGPPSRTVSGTRQAFDNTLFGEDLSDVTTDPFSQRLGSGELLRGTAPLTQPAGVLAAAGGTPLSFYSNATFEHDGSLRERRRATAEAVAGPAGEGVRRELFPGEAAAAEAGVAGVAEQQGTNAGEEVEGGGEVKAGGGGIARNDGSQVQLLIKTMVVGGQKGVGDGISHEDGDGASSPRQLIQAYRGNDEGAHQPQARGGSTGDITASAEEHALEERSAGVAAGMHSWASDADAAPEPTAAAAAADEEGAAAVAEGVPVSGGRSASTAGPLCSGLAAFGAVSAGSTPGTLLRGLRPGTPSAPSTPLAPPTPVSLKKAPEPEDKGISDYEKAKQEFQKAAEVSSGRVRKQAMAMDKIRSELESGSPKKESGGGSPRRPVASKKLPQQQLQDGEDGQSEGSSRTGSPSRLGGSRSPSPFGLIDLEGSDGDSDLLLLPGLEESLPQRAAALPPLQQQHDAQQQQQQHDSQQQRQQQPRLGASVHIAGNPGPSVSQDKDVLRLRGGASADDDVDDGWDYDYSYGSSTLTSAGDAKGSAVAAAKPAVAAAQPAGVCGPDRSNGAASPAGWGAGGASSPLAAGRLAAACQVQGTKGASPRKRRLLGGGDGSSGERGGSGLILAVSTVGEGLGEGSFIAADVKLGGAAAAAIGASASLTAAAAVSSIVAPVALGPSAAPAGFDGAAAMSKSTAEAPVAAAPQVGAAARAAFLATAAAFEPDIADAPLSPHIAQTRASGSDDYGYRVIIRTSSRQGAGTDGLVTLHLTTGRGAEIQLLLNASRDTFKDGSCLEFTLEECSGRSSGGGTGTGGVTAVGVWHDGQGYASAWLLEELVVQELSTGELGEGLEGWVGAWEVAALGSCQDGFCQLGNVCICM